MVTAENCTSRPVTGCRQVLAARARMAVWSSPRGGGALRSAPITAKRKRPQAEPPACGVLVITVLCERGGQGDPDHPRPRRAGMRRASSADRGRPSGERARQALRDRDRRQKAQQKSPIVAGIITTEERIEQGSWQDGRGQR